MLDSLQQERCWRQHPCTFGEEKNPCLKMLKNSSLTHTHTHTSLIESNWNTRFLQYNPEIIYGDNRITLVLALSFNACPVLRVFKSLQSCLFATLWTGARQASLPMGFSRQEWVAMASSRAYSQPRDQTCISRLLHWQAGSLSLGLI